GIEVIGEEIENPFGTDENDLPVDEIAMNISRNVKEILTFTHGLSVAPLLEGDNITTPDAAQAAE
ncbi:MAG: hypothetical protein IAF08_13620, partial [Rhizobacter sp.]|nr:hypothetical protein [Chlorobiales bacterium]